MRTPGGVLRSFGHSVFSLTLAAFSSKRLEDRLYRSDFLLFTRTRRAGGAATLSTQGGWPPRRSLWLPRVSPSSGGSMALSSAQVRKIIVDAGKLPSTTYVAPEELEKLQSALQAQASSTSRTFGARILDAFSSKRLEDRLYRSDFLLFMTFMGLLLTRVVSRLTGDGFLGSQPISFFPI